MIKESTQRRANVAAPSIVTRHDNLHASFAGKASDLGSDGVNPQGRLGDICATTRLDN